MNNTEASTNNLAKLLQRRQDSFLWITVILPGLVLTAFNIHSSFYPEQDIQRDMLLGAALSLLWLLIINARALFALWHNLPKNVISLVLSLVVWILLAPAFLHSFPIGHYVHLAEVYKEYKAKINASPNTRMVFDWGGAGWPGGPSFDRTLVYDPADSLIQENNVKDTEFRKTHHHLSNGSMYFDTRLITQRLIGHFYLVEEKHQ